MDDKQVVAALATLVWVMRSLHEDGFAQMVADATDSGRLAAMQGANAQDVAAIYLSAKSHVRFAPDRS